MKITTALFAAAALTTTAQADVLLFAGSGGVVYSLDTESGAVTPRGNAAGPVSSMTVHDGVLYLGDNAGFISAFDLGADAITETFAIPSDANALASLGEQLVVGNSAGTIDYVNPVTHQVERSVGNLGTDISAIGIDAGGIFVGGESSLALRGHIGNSEFSFFAACGGMIQSMAFGPNSMYLGGIAFGGATTGTVYLFDKFEGGVNYTGTFAVESDATATVYADGMLYIAGTDGVIHEMDPRDGSIARTFDAGTDIEAMTPEAGRVSCPADYNSDGALDFSDVARFLELFSQGNIASDINGDGYYDFFDAAAFITIYQSGC